MVEEVERTEHNVPASRYTHKVRYVVIVALLLAVLVVAIVVRGIASNLDNQTTPTQQSPNKASTGSTKQTGVPTNTTGTAADRTVPTPSASANDTLQSTQ